MELMGLFDPTTTIPTFANSAALSGQAVDHWRAWAKLFIPNQAGRVISNETMNNRTWKVFGGGGGGNDGQLQRPATRLQR